MFRTDYAQEIRYLKEDMALLHENFGWTDIAIVSLYVNDEMDFNEIAKYLDYSREYVRARISRVLRFVRKALKK